MRLTGSLPNGMHRPGRPRRARLGLESLEDRSVPSTFVVNSTIDDIVPGDGHFSLRKAITAANAHPGADTIILPAGVFRIAHNEAGEDADASGDFDITGSLTIQGAGAGLTVVDGQQIDRVFDIRGTAPSSIKVTLQGLTIQGGKVNGDGGGIRVGNADLVVRDCAVSGNRATADGGGISNATAPGTGNVTVVRSVVARNLFGGIAVKGTGSTLTLQGSAVWHNIGGGIAADTAKLIGCSVSGNTFGGGVSATTATLTNCTVSGNDSVDGGGISATTATLTGTTVSGNVATIGGGIAATTVMLTGSTVNSNVALQGGGIYSDTATLTSSAVRGNVADIGGGIWVITTVTVASSTISGNTATISDGGGLFALGTATLTDTTVSGNVTGSEAVSISHGNGAGVRAVTVTLTRCTVSGNTSTLGNGGGIDAGAATLTNCTISDNSAASGSGGGIFIPSNGTLTVTNSTVSGNRGLNGGGINTGAATLTNCTVAENVANVGGGLFHGAGGTFVLENTIVALNFDNGIGTGTGSPDVSGAFTSGGHNLIEDRTGSTGFADGVGGDVVGTFLAPIDPRLGPLADNGGPTKTMVLLAGSPAIDNGDNTATNPVTGKPLASDQRGLARRKDGNGDAVAVVDIGAFEK